ETVHCLCNRKNEIVLRQFRERRVQVYPGSVRYLRAVGDAGLQRAVVSASVNTHAVLVAAGIQTRRQSQNDGIVAELHGLRGKPAPDPYLTPARALHVAPPQTA